MKNYIQKAMNSKNFRLYILLAIIVIFSFETLSKYIDFSSINNSLNKNPIIKEFFTNSVGLLFALLLFLIIELIRNKLKLHKRIKSIQNEKAHNLRIMKRLIEKTKKCAKDIERNRYIAQYIFDDSYLYKSYMFDKMVEDGDIYTLDDHIIDKLTMTKNNHNKALQEINEWITKYKELPKISPIDEHGIKQKAVPDPKDVQQITSYLKHIAESIDLYYEILDSIQIDKRS